ncbi:MAG: hypothetical protein ACI8T1_001925 [Verrucomicrobiales bacterium]|jgi:hypothetical protein
MKALEQWCDIAEESELAPFLRLAKSFRKGADKIVAFCMHRLTSGKIEGFNNLISIVVHRAASPTLFTLGSSFDSFHPANLTEGLKKVPETVSLLYDASLFRSGLGVTPRQPAA